MRFSEAFEIQRSSKDDWFDPHLTVDTRLFIDPLLLLESGREWSQAHRELIAHFVHCYKLVAKATSVQSVSGQAAQRMLTFPEPAEFSLGYTATGTRGSGSGASFAQRMTDGIAVSIAAGLEHPEHIEEIGILNEGIGADRISDAAANVLKARFITYTQQVATRHGIQIKRHRVRNARCALKAGRWITETVLLPTNPITGKPVILTPEKLLNELPTLNADDWFDSDLNSDVRGELNLEVGEKVRKSDIVHFARKHPDRVRSWAREQLSRPDLHGYDFGADPLGVIQWDKEPVQYAQQHPIALSIVSTQEDLSTLIAHIINQFKRFIEHQRGWALLWNEDGSEKNELAAQLLFLGMAHHYLRLFNVEVDREVELGRGPVDFKAAAGTTARLLIEVKKAHNGRFWNGLEGQLPSYLTSDDCNEGWYVAIRYRNNRASRERMQQLPLRVSEVANHTGKSLSYSAIDARRPDSASQLTSDIQ